MLPYLLLTSVALIAVALAGIISSRHFVVVMIAVDLILLASTVALVSFIAYSDSPDPGAVIMLIGIWSAAAADTIALITFYVYMKAKGLGFDVAELSRLRW